jgi:predicted DCC family thiol-disulfide oxidoreductase YuxK
MPSFPPDAILLHDGPCMLCRTSVRWVHDHDRRRRFAFVPLDSAEGRECLFEAGLEPAYADSVVLLHAGRAWRHSSAAVHTLWLLGGPWAALGCLLWLVPERVRDFGYRLVARHRHLWPFGDVCELPGLGAVPGGRFADAEERAPAPGRTAGSRPLPAREAADDAPDRRPGAPTR